MHNTCTSGVYKVQNEPRENMKLLILLIVDL